MEMNISKGALEVILSRLEGFSEPKVRLEQYVMDSRIGADVLWRAYMRGDIERKVIVDLGCGTGILGIGAILLGAKRVFFVDIDEKALKIAKNNLKKAKSEDKIAGEAVFINKDVRDFVSGEDVKVDVVIENPPFGVKVRGSDRKFLKKALETADVVYHFGKEEGRGFIERFTGEIGGKVSDEWVFDYPIKAKYGFHRKRIHRFGVSCWRIEKTL